MASTGLSGEARRRLKEEVERFGTQAELARQSGIRPTTLNQIVNGTGDVGASLLERVCSALQVSVDYILTGVAARAGEQMVTVGLLNDIKLSAGSGAIAPFYEPDRVEMRFPASWLRERFGRVDQLDLVPIEGKSMEPTIPDGSLGLVNRADQGRRPGIYAFRYDDVLYVKRLEFQKDRVLVLSDNPGYEGFIVKLPAKNNGELADDDEDAEKFRMIGRVVWIVRMM